MAWYNTWFGALYLELYPHRDDEEAAAQIAFILEHEPHVYPAMHIVDTACGNGRHLSALARRGFSVSGFDLSEALLAEASKRPELTGHVSQADMRSLPLESASVDILLSMFTSFGYFETDDEHQQLLCQWYTLLRPAGSLWIDYLNKPQVIASLVPESTRETQRLTVTEQRTITAPPERVVKEISITDKSTGEMLHFTESVRMFSAEEIGTMLKHAGFSDIALYGDFTGAPFGPASERCILRAGTADGE